MGTDCQNKNEDRLPIQNIWGQIDTNAKYMGTDCKLKYMGTLFQYCLPKYTYTKNNYHAWYENWSTLHIIHENLMREDQKRRGIDYAPQQRVLNKK